MKQEIILTLKYEKDYLKNKSKARLFYKTIKNNNMELYNYLFPTQDIFNARRRNDF